MVDGGPFSPWGIWDSRSPNAENPRYVKLRPGSAQVDRMAGVRRVQSSDQRGQHRAGFVAVHDGMIDLAAEPCEPVVGRRTERIGWLVVERVEAAQLTVFVD